MSVLELCSAGKVGCGTSNARVTVGTENLVSVG